MKLLRAIQAGLIAKPIPATVIDVGGSRCSVRLSEDGRRLHGIRWIGTAPNVGDTVLVDYKIGPTPMVVQTLEVATAGTTGNIDVATVGSQATLADPTEAGGHNNLAGLQGGLADTGNGSERYHLSAAEYFTALEKMIVFVTEGDLEVSTGTVRLANHFSCDLNIVRVILHIGTAPTGADVLVDIHKNGSSIFAPDQRPRIYAGTNIGISANIANPQWLQGQYLTYDIDQKGSSVAGADLTAHVIAVAS